MMAAGSNSTTVTGTRSPFQGDPINESARAIFATLGSLMIVCGVTGNAVLIGAIFRRFQRKRHVHNLFIANLAVADILALGYWLTFFVLDLIVGYYPVVNHTHCVVNGVVVGVLTAVSILSLLSISLNRYLHVCHSHLYTRTFTLPRTLLSCLLIWLLGLALSLPPALPLGAGSYHYSVQTHICSFNRARLTYSKMVVVLFSTLPMLLIGYWNFAIFRFWRRARMSLSCRYPLAQTGERRGERRGARFLGARCLGAKWRLRRGGEAGAPEAQQDGSASERDRADVRESPEVAAQGVSGRSDNDEKGNKAAESVEAKNASSAAVGDDAEGMSDDLDGRACEASDCAQCSQLRELNDRVQEIVLKPTEDVPAGETTGHSVDIPRTSDTATEEGSSLTCNLESADQGNASASTAVESSTDIKTAALSSSTSSLKGLHSSRRPKGNLSKAMQALQLRRKKQKAREVAFVRSLLVVFILMFACFIPYGVIMVLSSYVTIPPEVVMLGIMFLFTNNAVNWIVYGVMNPVFRSGYVKCVRQVLHVCCRVSKKGGPRFLNASQSSLVTPSRVLTENDPEQSCVSLGASGDP